MKAIGNAGKENSESDHQDCWSLRVFIWRELGRQSIPWGRRAKGVLYPNLKQKQPTILRITQRAWLACPAVLDAVDSEGVIEERILLMKADCPVKRTPMVRAGTEAASSGEVWQRRGKAHLRQLQKEGFDRLFFTNFTKVPMRESILYIC